MKIIYVIMLITFSTSASGNTCAGILSASEVKTPGTFTRAVRWVGERLGRTYGDGTQIPTRYVGEYETRLNARLGTNQKGETQASIEWSNLVKGAQLPHRERFQRGLESFARAVGAEKEAQEFAAGVATAIEQHLARRVMLQVWMDSEFKVIYGREEFHRYTRFFDGVWSLLVRDNKYLDIRTLDQLANLVENAPIAVSGASRERYRGTVSRFVGVHSIDSTNWYSTETKLLIHFGDFDLQLTLPLSFQSYEIWDGKPKVGDWVMQRNKWGEYEHVEYLKFKARVLKHPDSDPSAEAQGAWVLDALAAQWRI